MTRLAAAGISFCLLAIILFDAGWAATPGNAAGTSGSSMGASSSRASSSATSAASRGSSQMNTACPCSTGSPGSTSV